VTEKQLGRDMACIPEHYASKVPEVTLGFWIIKILATTLGETGGDTVTMTWLKADVMVNKGYLVGSAIFLSALIVLVVIQIAAKKFHPFLYWSVIVASTTAGTTMADPVFGYWLHWRIVAPVCLSHGCAWPVVLAARVHFGGNGQYA
jgi:uncharacterized membrane-anchored protein